MPLALFFIFRVTASINYPLLVPSPFFFPHLIAHWLRAVDPFYLHSMRARRQYFLLRPALSFLLLNYAQKINKIVLFLLDLFCWVMFLHIFFIWGQGKSRNENYLPQTWTVINNKGFLYHLRFHSFDDKHRNNEKKRKNRFESILVTGELNNYSLYLLIIL